MLDTDRTRKTRLASLAGAIALMASHALRAQAPAPTATPTPAPKWYDDITANAFVSTSYSYNFNKPPSGTNALRVFDFDDNTIKLDVAEVVVQKAVSAPGDAGFRVDLVAGGSVPRVSSSPGLLQGQDVDVQQAFVSYILPVGNGLRVDAGKWVTHIGWELIEGYDGYNDNATRSILFGYAIPFTHTGIKATYAFSDKVSGMLEIVNGCEVVKDNNSGKSVGLQLAFTPSKAVSIWANVMHGPERSGVNGDPRTHLNLVAQWRATDRMALTLDAAYGTEKGAVAPGETATWTAFAGYARFGISDTFAFTLRGEYFDDSDGARTGAAQKVKEVTLTPEIKLSSKLVFRADLRVDFSDERFFPSDSGAKKQQTTLLLNALYAF
jgi:hypothetical protein